MINDKADEVLKELFQSLLSRYQIGLETSMTSSDCIFDCVHLLYYKCYKENFKQDGSYKDIQKDNKGFQYAVTVALNHEKLGTYSERITEIELFINEYN